MTQKKRKNEFQQVGHNYQHSSQYHIHGNVHNQLTTTTTNQHHKSQHQINQTPKQKTIKRDNLVLQTERMDLLKAKLCYLNKQKEESDSRTYIFQNTQTLFNRQRVEIRTETEEVQSTNRNVHSKIETRTYTENPKFILNDKKNKKFMIMKPKRHIRMVEQSNRNDGIVKQNLFSWQMNRTSNWNGANYQPNTSKTIIGQNSGKTLGYKKQDDKEQQQSDDQINISGWKMSDESMENIIQ